MITTSSFIFASAQNNSNNDSFSYGFIVPLPQGLDTSNETFENSRVRHLINDLLREDISVYWAKDNFSALSKIFHKNNSYSENIFFKEGAFIIPFTDDDYKDSLIISILNDYNQTNELKPGDSIKNQVFVICEKLSIKTDKLIEPKIAQHLGISTRYSWPTYLLQADDGGFLNYEYLLDSDTAKQLNNDNFNILIWPYLPDHATELEQLITFSNTAQVNSIRKFVRDGGGFIGTCYGAQAASSGIVFLSTPLAVRYARNPDLSRILPGFYLYLSDSKMWASVEALSNNHISYHQVEKPDHPVFHGVNNTIKDFFKGLVFVWLGENTHVLATFKDLRDSYDGSEVNKNTKRLVMGKASWVNTTFGDGKVVLYSSHPDFINNIYPMFTYKNRTWYGDEYYGRRIIHNTMFYVTSEENIEIYTSLSRPISFVNSIVEKTENLSFDTNSSNHFEILSERLVGFSNDLQVLENKTMNLRNLFAPLENKSKIFEKSERFLRYAYWYCGLYNDYVNRALDNLEKLKLIIPLLSEYDESIIELVDELNDNLNERLNNSEKIFLKVSNLADKLEDTVTSPRLSVIKKLTMLKDRRTLLSTYIIELKYVPQIYFESLKLLRHLWYSYEANIAI